MNLRCGYPGSQRPLQDICPTLLIEHLCWNTCIDTKTPFKWYSTWTSRAKKLPTGKNGEFRTSNSLYHLQESAITSLRSHVIICTGISFTTFFMWNSGLVCKCWAIHKHVFALVFHSLVVSWSGFFNEKIYLVSIHSPNFDVKIKNLWNNHLVAKKVWNIV